MGHWPLLVGSSRSDTPQLRDLSPCPPPPTVEIGRRNPSEQPQGFTTTDPAPTFFLLIVFSVKLVLRLHSFLLDVDSTHSDFPSWLPQRLRATARPRERLPMASATATPTARRRPPRTRTTRRNMTFSGLILKSHTGRGGWPSSRRTLRYV